MFGGEVREASVDGVVEEVFAEAVNAPRPPKPPNNRNNNNPPENRDNFQPQRNQPRMQAPNFAPFANAVGRGIGKVFGVGSTDATELTLMHKMMFGGGAFGCLVISFIISTIVFNAIFPFAGIFNMIPSVLFTVGEVWLLNTNFPLSRFFAAVLFAFDAVFNIVGVHAVMHYPINTGNMISWFLSFIGFCLGILPELLGRDAIRSVTGYNNNRRKR